VELNEVTFTLQDTQDATPLFFRETFERRF